MEEGFASGEAMARIAGKALKVIATVAGGSAPQVGVRTS